MEAMWRQQLKCWPNFVFIKKKERGNKVFPFLLLLHPRATRESLERPQDQPHEKGDNKAEEGEPEEQAVVVVRDVRSEPAEAHGEERLPEDERGRADVEARGSGEGDPGNGVDGRVLNLVLDLGPQGHELDGRVNLCIAHHVKLFLLCHNIGPIAAAKMVSEVRVHVLVATPEEGQGAHKDNHGQAHPSAEDAGARAVAGEFREGNGINVLVPAPEDEHPHKTTQNVSKTLAQEGRVVVDVVTDKVVLDDEGDGRDPVEGAGREAAHKHVRRETEDSDNQHEGHNVNLGVLAVGAGIRLRDVNRHTVATSTAGSILRDSANRREGGGSKSEQHNEHRNTHKSCHAGAEEVAPATAPVAGSLVACGEKSRVLRLLKGIHPVGTSKRAHASSAISFELCVRHFFSSFFFFVCLMFSLFLQK